ncbi:AbrB/MazE/SpoVT family DNA-binding domain-containing protein [Neobacillus drentensis]|uniref:AbrB/MazE/SpoVT family DNA-binding domain-containing protein n=1 Tax=Neobacillus drentensis TaxID=220684 RepID=UPI003002A205
MVVKEMTREEKRDSHIRRTRRVARMGNSLGIGIPAEFVDLFKIERGDEFEFSINEETKEIIIKPVQVMGMPKGVRPEVMKALGKAFSKYDQTFRNLKNR